MSWYCAVCRVEHDGRPHVEVRQARCCHAYVRACELVGALTEAELADAIAAAHARDHDLRLAVAP